MKTLDPCALAVAVSAETGLQFTGSEGYSASGVHWFELSPAGYSPSKTFVIRLDVGWRRIDVKFRLGNFAGDLLSAIQAVDEAGRRAFNTVLDACCNAGANVVLSLNGNTRSRLDGAMWLEPWRSFEFGISKGMLAINEGYESEDMRLVQEWATRAAAAVLALLPVEEEVEQCAEAQGLPEGAKVRIEINRYERDRRNRALALAIHGHECTACGIDMTLRYGPVAVGLIEVHHVVPVSELGPGYVVDPGKDLVPLCPDCHSVAHRRMPPFSVKELQDMLRLACR